MADYRRRYVPGGTFFFTVVTHKRRPIFTDESTVALLRTVTAEARAATPFDIVAAVVLPDHLHTIWTLPGGDDDFAGRWSRIKSQFTRRHLAAGGSNRAVTQRQSAERRRGIWQRRYFEHTLRDEDDLRRHVEYIHYNPVKHGLAACPKDWAWSSFTRYVRNGVYPIDWCCGQEPPAYVRMGVAGE